MAELNNGPVELGAEMDYAEHEKTYNMFLGLTKYCTLGCAAILVGMTAGLLGGAGFIGGTLAMIIVAAIGYYLLK